MTNEQYIQLVEKHPQLTAHGYGVSIDERLNPSGKEWDMAREELLRAHQEFEYCCQYIAENPDLPGKRTAYHWKHRVEDWLQSNMMRPDYIPQGVFILATLHMGYRVHRIRKSDGARIGERIA